MSHAIKIETDLPCVRCDYNLRGLSLPGRCPECGEDIELCLLAWQMRLATAPLMVSASDRLWVDQLIDGAVLAIVSTILIVIYAFLPWSMFVRNSTAREVTLGFCVTAWTLSLASLWKLAARQPNPKSTTRMPILRTAAVLYLGFPIGWATCGHRASAVFEYFFILFVLTALITGFVCACGFYSRIYWIARRLNSSWLRAEALIAAILWPLMVCFLAPGVSEPSSLSLMAALPGVHMVAPEMGRDFVRYPMAELFHSSRWGNGDVILLIIVAVCAMGTAMVFHLLCVLVRERPAKVKPFPAAEAARPL